NNVIIEDWVDSDDEETPLGFSEIKKKTVLKSKNNEESFKNRSPRSQDSFGQGSRRRGLGFREQKLCYVCYSPNHLIKDCDLHERNLRENSKPRPVGTSEPRESRPVWNNSRRVNHRNFSSDNRYPQQRRSYSPKAVLTRKGLISTVRLNSPKTVPSQSTARPDFPRPMISTSTGRPYYPRMDNIRPRASSFSPSRRSYNTRTIHRPNNPKPIMKSKWVKKESTAGIQAVLPQEKGKNGSVVKNPTQEWRPKGAYIDHGNPEEELKDHAIIDSGCPRNMTGDKEKLLDFKAYKGGYVAFGNDPKGGRITGKGTIKTSCIDFENVSYVKELKFNLLSFKFVDENLVILRAPRKNDVYSLNLKSIIPSEGVTCLVAKATDDKAILWHRRLGHVNFKNIKKLVKGNLVRGLPSKSFKHDHSCLACRKGKQHKASWYWVTKEKVQNVLHVNFLENQETQNEKIPKEQGISLDDVEDMDDQQFIVPCTTQYNVSSGKRTKKVSQALGRLKWVEADARRPASIQASMSMGVINQTEKDKGVRTQVARIEQVRLILAFAIFHGLYLSDQVDVKSAFLYGNITEEVYVKQPPGFEDPAHPNKVLQSCQGALWTASSPKSMSSMCRTEDLMQKEFKMSPGGGNSLSFRASSHAIQWCPHKSLGKDEEGEDVDISSHSKVLIYNAVSKGSLVHSGSTWSYVSSLRADLVLRALHGNNFGNKTLPLLMHYDSHAAERRYPLSREFDDKILDHGMEV
ncbi:ribonuclease H-like domain-containing protein, partial [Tanacetum coccineum]